MSSTSPAFQEPAHGLSVRQWSILFVSFCLGVASVFVVDHLFFSGAASGGTAQAATATL